MRILLLNQFFYPDTAATSQLLTDLARELAAQSHDVIAICGDSDYVAANDRAMPPPVTIIRSKSVPFSRSNVGRLASYLNYILTAAVQSLLSPTPDVILTLTTPPLLSLVGTLVKRMRGSQHLIWEMDLYPDVAVDLGVFRPNSLLARIVGVSADFSRHNADGIIALGEDMQERLVSRGIPRHKIRVVHNWADRSEITPQPLPPLPLTIYYSGNLGLAHDIATIQQGMLTLAGEEHIRFTFAGGGPQRETLQSFCAHHGLRQVTFRAYCDRDQLSNSLAEGHLGLVTQKPETTGSIVPSKVYGIMASGRPILYIGSRRATPSRIIERFNCGWQVEAGDSVGLVSLLRRLATRPDEIREAGERARRALVDHFDRRIGVAQITDLLGAQPHRTAASA